MVVVVQVMVMVMVDMVVQFTVQVTVATVQLQAMERVGKEWEQRPAMRGRMWWARAMGGGGRRDWSRKPGWVGIVCFAF